MRISLPRVSSLRTFLLGITAASLLPLASAETIGHWRFENVDKLGENSAGPNLELKDRTGSSVALIESPFPEDISGTDTPNRKSAVLTKENRSYL